MDTKLDRTDPPRGGEPVVPVENDIVEALMESGATVATAESLTAGAICERLCSCPGTEDLVLGGVVTYSTSAKRRVLGVTADEVVTPEAALEMAVGVKELFGADVGLSLTGVAGPDRQDGQPVGTVFVGWSLPTGDGWVQLACAGTPEQIRREAAEQAMHQLLAALRSTSPDRP